MDRQLPVSPSVISPKTGNCPYLKPAWNEQDLVGTLLNQLGMLIFLSQPLLKVSGWGPPINPNLLVLLFSESSFIFNIDNKE